MAPENTSEPGTAKPARKPRQSPKSDTAPVIPPAAMGDNSAISEAEQREAVYRISMAAVRRNLAEVDKIKSALKVAQKGLTTARNAFKRDTLIDLQDLDYILRRSELTRTDIGKRQDHINWMLELEGLPLGGQQSLFAQFDKRPTLIRDQADWEAEGKRHYNRGGDREVPETVPGEFHQAFLKGFADEEERTIWAMAAVKPVDRDTDISGSRPEIEPEPDADEVEADLDDQARKLRLHGFTQRAPEHAGQPEQDAA